MARATTPRTRKREAKTANYFDPGVKGRATGLELAQGTRDEYGLEEIAGIFSSPQKSTRSSKRPGRKSNDTLSSSEPMELAHSPALEPIEVLSARQIARTSRSSLPPVRPSPHKKTNIGGTPRRLTSAGSLSPERRSMTPLRAQQLQSPKRRLDFSKPRDSIEFSPPKRHTPRFSGSSSKLRNSVYDIPRDNEELGGAAEETYDQLGIDETIDEETSVQLPQDTLLPAFGDDDGADESRQMSLDPVQRQILEEEAAAAIQVSSQKRRVGRPRGSNASRISQTQEVSGIGEADESAVEKGDAAEGGEVEATEVEMAVVKKRRGRPPKNAKPDQPAARVALQKRDQNSKPSEPRTGKNQTVPSSGPQAHQLARMQTPMEDDGAMHTRSGRLSFKPLNYWKGERAEYKVHSPLPSIQQIVRIDDLEVPKRARSGSAPPRKRKRKYTVFQDDGDEVDGEEPWELEDGVISGPIAEWDDSVGAGAPENETEREIAFAASRIEPRPAPGGDFHFAKTLTLPFFGSGIVELGPRGFKRTKNTRKMQMVFFVHYGKVTVEVAGNRFIITKGGVWQVPRGNFYSIANETDNPAKIFFAQGCQLPIEKETVEGEAIEAE